MQSAGNHVYTGSMMMALLSRVSRCQAVSSVLITISLFCFYLIIHCYCLNSTSCLIFAAMFVVGPLPHSSVSSFTLEYNIEICSWFNLSYSYQILIIFRRAPGPIQVKGFHLHRMSLLRFPVIDPPTLTACMVGDNLVIPVNQTIKR